MEEGARVLGKAIDAIFDLILNPCDAVYSARAACKDAMALDNVNLMLRACFAFFKAAAACYGRINPDDFEAIWRIARQFIEGGALADVLGKYLVALAVAGRHGEVERALEEWGGVLESDRSAALATYAALAMFDLKYAERALRYLPDDVKSDLPRYADALHEAVESGQLPDSGPWPTGVLESTGGVGALLALSFLGVAFCRQPWGLKLARAAAKAFARAVQRYGIRIDYYLHALEEPKSSNCASARRYAVRAYYHLA